MSEWECEGWGETFQLLGKLEEVGVGMLNLEIKFDGLQQYPLECHQLILEGGGEWEREGCGKGGERR